MNKQVIVLLAAIAAFLPGASAQRGDTMSFSNFRPWYYCDFWPEPYMLTSFPDLLPEHSAGCGWELDCRLFRTPFASRAGFGIGIGDYSEGTLQERPGQIQVGMHTGSPMTIDGLAVTLTRQAHLHTPHRYLQESYDRLQLMVLDSARNIVASGTVPFSDSLAGGFFNIPLSIALTRTGFSDTLSYIYEVYFDSPVAITDSFYIEVRAISNTLDTSISVPIQCLQETHAYHSLPWDQYGNPSDFLYPEIPWFEKGGWQMAEFDTAYKYYLEFITDDEWHRPIGLHMGMALAFPILATDCQSPALRVENVNNRHARLHWEAGRFAQKWEVSYGPAGTPPGGGTVAQTLFTQHAMPNLDPEAEYVAYVRSYCAGHDTLWSDWGDGITFRLADVAGLNPADGIALEATPNPAAKAAHVAASAPLLRLEAFNSAGVRMADLPASGMEADLDVSGWPSGVYLLRVHTAIGTAQRPLVVLH